MKQLARITGLAAAALFLVGCGDDSSSSPSGKAAEYAALEEAGDCAPSRYGETVFVTQTSEFYFCGGKRWTLVDDEEDGKSSTSGKDGMSSAKSSSASEEGRTSDDVLGTCGNGNIGEYKVKKVSNPAISDTTFICSTVGWIDAMHWSWDVPKEARLNPNIDYGTMTDNRDGQTYKTVVIGSQTWMAENLNYEYKIDGASYGNLCYGDTARYCAVTGRLYTWAAAMDSASTGCGDEKTCTASAGRVRGVCPNGWHLPSQAEWQTLFTAVGGQSAAGTALKTTSGWYSGAQKATSEWYKNCNGTDDFGFSALPSSCSRDLEGNHCFESAAGEDARFWSSSEYDAKAWSAWVMYLYYGYARADLDGGDKSSGVAVRCLRD